jgi:hypothetical protein
MWQRQSRGRANRLTKKAKILAISHLTEQNHAPIYAAHAASETTVLRTALLLWQDENSRQVGLFDIVIRGRGTWAAARSPLLSNQDA